MNFCLKKGVAYDSGHVIFNLNKLIFYRAVEAIDAKEYTWMTTDWSPCSAPCGQIGHQIRGAICQVTECHPQNATTRSYSRSSTVSYVLKQKI